MLTTASSLSTCPSPLPVDGCCSSNVVARQGVGYVLQEVGEELGEMIGVTVLIWATLELLHAGGIRVQPRLRR
jgi:hypothetical protein